MHTKIKLECSRGSLIILCLILKFWKRDEIRVCD